MRNTYTTIICLTLRLYIGAVFGTRIYSGTYGMHILPRHMKQWRETRQQVTQILRWINGVKRTSKTSSHQIDIYRRYRLTWLIMSQLSNHMNINTYTIQEILHALGAYALVPQEHLRNKRTTINKATTVPSFHVILE
ncbi:hypothetical protein F4677DRAFT_405145 [Hypoxylon crocopeplum]|nr:hypothetical protein F4677DRAFT_405145 [Hypoxylon crocopeplum]